MVMWLIDCELVLAPFIDVLLMAGGSCTLMIVHAKLYMTQLQ